MRRRRHHHRHHHNPTVWFCVEIADANRYYFERRRLIPNQEIIMDNVTVNIGHTVTCSIEYDDANGNPMLTPVAPDAPPAWTQTTPATDTMAVAPDGSQDVLTAIAAGGDTVSVALAVGGKAFSASVGITVSPAPQVLTSIRVVTQVS